MQTTIPYKTLAPDLMNGTVSAETLTRGYLEAIDSDTETHAFVTVMRERALEQASHVDKQIRDGFTGKLAGLVLGIKDNLAVEGERLTCGSRMLETFVSPYNATVIEKLEAAGAIFIGKTNMDEFAMGSSNETSLFGAVRNPHNPLRVPGGSSGGSAAAVAGNLCMAALGSDTGGSIRQPAAFCGVVGLKPTYGRVSRYGLVAFASSLDQIGPLARSVSDVALIMEVISGPDERDATVASQPVPAYTEALNRDVNGLRIGLPEEYFADGLDAEIRAAIDSQVERLRGQGAVIKTVSLPHTDYAIATYYILATAEASSNLERYDGARYGYRHPNARTLQEMYVKSRTAGFGAEVKRRIMLGTFVLSTGYYDAYYRRAQKVRTLIRRDFDAVFTQVDCLLTPTTPTVAFGIGEKVDDPLTMYLSDVYTVSVNLAGLPAVSLPCGQSREQLPIGLQLIGRSFDESTLIRVGHALERFNS